MKQLFEEMLAPMKAGELALTAAPQPPRLTGTLAVEEEKEKAQGVFMVGYRGADMFSPDRYALELIDEASSDLGSRFFIGFARRWGSPTTSARARCRAWFPGSSPFTLEPIRGKLEPVKTALLDEIGKLASDGLTNDELARAKKKLDRSATHREPEQRFVWLHVGAGRALRSRLRSLQVTGKRNRNHHGRRRSASGGEIFSATARAGNGSPVRKV